MSLASEFPNDNPALHRGVIWVCLEPTGRALAERPRVDDASTGQALAERPRVDDAPAVEASVTAEPPVPASEPFALYEVSDKFALDDLSDEEEPFVVEELEPLDADVEGETIVLHNSAVLPKAPDDPFTVLVCTLSDVAMWAGSLHVASFLPALLLDGCVPEPLDESIASALRAAGIWDGSAMAPSFLATTRAWRAILRGTSDDFSACGAAMLDEWAANLLAHLLGAPMKVPALRKELRGRGVAAFGLIEAA